MGIMILYDAAKPSPTTTFIVNHCKVVNRDQAGLHIRCKTGPKRTMRTKKKRDHRNKRGPAPRPRHRPLHNYKI